jgi:hypothetical protein
MNSIDVANQLRAIIIIYFSRNKKEFFSGIFWSIDMILTNYWKIYKSLYSPFLSSNNIRLRNIHREFLKILVELLFCCDSKTYTETVSRTTFKEYPKYSYTPYKPGPKLQFPESISQSLIDISRKTPFIFKGDSRRPRTSIPTKITPISQYQHIKITIRGFILSIKTLRRYRIIK